MFEWHGWAVIRGNFTVDDDEDAEREDRARQTMVERLLADQAYIPNEIVDIRYVNGACYVWLGGGHNHRVEKPIELFRLISAAAPGSYGIMYCFDHNHVDQPWQRWVMRRGHVHLERDTSLSPHIGLVEDPDGRR